MLGASTPSAKGGVYGTTFVDNWLGSAMTDRVAAEVVAHEGLSITASDLASAKAVFERRVAHALSTFARGPGASAPGCGASAPGRGASAPAVLSRLPTWFVAQQTRAEAAQDLLDVNASGGGLTRAGSTSYFRAHRASFERDCIRVIVVKSRASAKKVEAALPVGASFANEAAAASVTSRTGSVPPATDVPSPIANTPRLTAASG